MTAGKSPRRSGVLLHPTSLPGPWGMGDIGPAARTFVRELNESRQTVWQFLPLGPVDRGGSPYAGGSAFAANPLLISIDDLIEDGLLDRGDPQLMLLRSRLTGGDERRVDFAAQHGAKMPVLRVAASRLLEREGAAVLSEAGRLRGLSDWTEFAARKALSVGRPHWEWMDATTPAIERLDSETRIAAAIQVLFERQWTRLRGEAEDAGVLLVGDLPIFVAEDSADVYAHADLFRLGKNGRADPVAGVPPDFFSPTGQKWGNPLYDWEAMAEQEYAWWVRRLLALLARVDLIRVDHFRGFAAAWEVPQRAPDAREGAWGPGPGAPLFEALSRAIRTVGRLRPDGRLPILAEDLGVITPDVERLRDAFGLPGMRILQFGFGGEADHPFLPHTFPEACVVYTGTHDNDTVRGWFASTDERSRDHARRYLGVDGSDIAWDLIRAAASSRAELSVYPLQDVLDLDGSHRMNVPGTTEGNWTWRMPAARWTEEVRARLAALTAETGRG